jgi:endonuclease/exonuclease/phosphatase family metal-dependent hydrolase
MVSLGAPITLAQSDFREDSAPRTFPARFPFFSLDRIWVRPTETMISLDVHKTPLARIASDHLPIKAIISC